MIDPAYADQPEAIDRSLDPIVRIAASAPNGQVVAAKSDRWRQRERSTLSRVTDENQVKLGGRRFFESRNHDDTRALDRVAANAAVIGQYQQAEWQHELTTLRLAMAEMRESLRASLKREQRARHLAFHDDLTALPNRRYFLEQLGAALRSPADSLHLAIIYLDLDGFKTINDAHGHETGDRLLNFVAARLAGAVRAEDLVSRIGGDEYACLIAGVPNRERLQQIAASLAEAVSTPFAVDLRVLTVQPSIGIAVYPVDGTTSEELMKSADQAMYRAKQMHCTYRFSERSVAVSSADQAMFPESSSP